MQKIKVKEPKKIMGYLAAIVSSILFGVMAILVKLALKTGLDPFDVVFFRFFFTSFIIAIYVLVRRINLKLQWAQIWRIIFLALVGYAAMNITYYTAFDRMPVSLAGMMHYIYPVAAVVIGRVIFKDHIGKECYFAVALAVGGAMLLSFGDFQALDAIGILCALLSGILYGLYAVGLGRPALADLDSCAIVFYLCVFSTLFLGGFEAIRGVNPFGILTTKGLLIMLANAFFCTGFAMMIFRKAIVSVGAVPTTILSTLEPITAAGLSLICFHETFNFLMIMGSALILIAVILTVKPPKQKDTSAPSQEEEQTTVTHT
ncbi:MAG: DMT family transporter [Bacillota bacterium]|nr:DMT family transporter [Bacillota bacterium]